MTRYTALIPAAGSGIRLRPFTFTRPKPLVYVAGKPILGHILDNLRGIVDDVTVIVGYMADRVEEYCTAAHGDHFSFNFVHQQDPLGLGHAVLQGRDAVPDGGLVITLGDEIFGMTYANMVVRHHANMPCDASLGLKKVDDPRNYGVVETDEEGRITAMVEKPEEPKTNDAIAGVYIFEQASDIFSALQDLVDRDIRTRGEFQLTDAMVLMNEGGAVFKGFIIDKWYDCGRPDMLVRVNRRLLEDQPPTNHVDQKATVEHSVVVQPVAVEGGCVIRGSVVGPYVSLGKDTTVENAILTDCIVGEGCTVRNVILQETVLADRVTVSGRSHKMTVGEETLIEID